MIYSSRANNHCPHQNILVYITSKLQIEQSNGISNPTSEKSELNSHLYSPHN